MRLSGVNSFMNAEPTDLERILVVEDEPELASLITTRLASLPVRAESVGDGELGLRRALQETWDMLVLDISLPRRDGLSVCRQVRRRNAVLPILMLTALHSDTDRVIGLESGADDYLCKPFSMIELQARVRALLRRGKLARNPTGSDPSLNDAAPGPVVVNCGSIRVDRRAHRAWCGQDELTLTPREFDLLWTLTASPVTVFSRSELLDKVWGASHEGFEHTVNTHLHRLRAKLSECGEPPDRIENVWGRGYRLRS